MIGLEQILVAQIILASTEMKCELKASPQINVVAKGVDRIVDISKSVAELNAAFGGKITTKNPYGDSANTFIEGLNAAGIGMSGSYQFSTETAPAIQKACLYVSQINIDITLDPTIYIAREYPPGSCHYNAVLEHEQKHSKVDRYIVNKYSNIIIKALHNTFKTIGYAQGPVDTAQLVPVQKRMEAYIKAVIDQFSQNMNKERKMLQQQIDSLAEYQRVDAMCPDKPRPVIR